MSEIISYCIKGFEYKTPWISVNESGELKVKHRKETVVVIPKVTLLFRVNDDCDGNIKNIEGVDVANAFILHKVIHDNIKDPATYSSGLIQFFSFLELKGLNWQHMETRKNQRPTYMFKKFLEAAYRNTNKDDHIAGSTCKSYMRVIINFYRFHMRKGTEFLNSPFEDETLSINIDNDASSIHRNKAFSVASTDLRLDIPKAHVGVVPKKLQSLTKDEWKLLDILIRKDRKVLSVKEDQSFWCSLPIEFTYIFLLMRYTGMRREEALTFNLSLVTKPTDLQLKKGTIRVDIGPRFGVSTKNDQEREIEIPSGLMNQLHEYSTSTRYIKRRNKYIAKTEGSETGFEPIFLSSRGSLFSKETVNARWSEIRRTMTVKLGYAFTHKPHNLRSTYGVMRLFSLLDAGMKQSDALTFIQDHLGHSALRMTLHYLRQTEKYKSADELAEIAIDHLHNLEDFEVKS